ncbi:MAG TPA: hypothetical protein VJU16_08105 [Planctomycetota bacterium]|nr:hypothetical protein [Planctomycetota bacterium]
MRILVAVSAALFALTPQEPKPRILEAGALTCEIHISRTATIFHVVDQLAEWSEYCHRQYGRHFARGLTAFDRDLLAGHVKIRKERGWGAGLEQTFYSPLDLEGAIKVGLGKKHLDAGQAEIERKVLAHFGPRVDKLIADHRVLLESYADRLLKEKERLTDFADRISRLFGGAKVAAPVYLIANPHDVDGGGGFNGQIVVVEIPRVSDAYPMLLHEIFHAFLQLRRDRIEEAAKKVDGLDFETLNEGLAHALAPGIFHTDEPGADPLEKTVKRYQREGKVLKDYYYRVYRFGLELRPLMKEALESKNGSIDKVIPKAAELWRVLVEKERARN